MRPCRRAAAFPLPPCVRGSIEPCHDLIEPTTTIAWLVRATSAIRDHQQVRRLHGGNQEIAQHPIYVAKLMSMNDSSTSGELSSLVILRAGHPGQGSRGGPVEIDEIAARLLRQYWALVLLCVLAPLVAITLMVAKQPPMYAASARIVSGNTVPASNAQAQALVSQIQGIATGKTTAASALKDGPRHAECEQLHHQPRQRRRAGRLPGRGPHGDRPEPAGRRDAGQGAGRGGRPVRSTAPGRAGSARRSMPSTRKSCGSPSSTAWSRRRPRPTPRTSSCSPSWPGSTR